MIIIFLVLLLTSACSDRISDIHKEQEAVILKIAESAENKKYFDYASILREKYQKLQPYDYGSMKYLAFDLENSSEWQKSIHYLNKLHKHKPNDQEVILHLGHAYAHIGAWEYAFDNYKYILTHKPNVQAYNGMGVVLNSANNYKMALVCFDIALAIDPANSAVMNNKALTLAMLGNKISARKTLSNLSLIESSPYYEANLNMVNTSKNIRKKLFKTKSNSSLVFDCKKGRIDILP